MVLDNPLKSILRRFNMELISLVEYAKLNGISDATARQRAIRGSFTTARKIGRNWVIDKDEPLTDNRKRKEDLK